MAFQIKPLRPVEQNELFFRLYLKREGSGSNDKTIVQSKEHIDFGLVLASDLPIYDGFGPKAKLVARLQGLQSQAGKLTDGWQASVNIVFEDVRFKGSTLHVMGTGLHKREWAIVGGTGEFTLAQGIMYNLLMHGEFQEIELRALYTPMKKVPWTLGVPGATGTQQAKHENQHTQVTQ